MQQEYLESYEEMYERFCIMFYDGNVSFLEARAYVINHSNLRLKGKAILEGWFMEFKDDDRTND